MKLRWIFISVIAIFGVAVILFLYITRGKDKGPAIQKQESQREIVAATGKVEGWIESEISSKIPGKISEIRVKEGDNVKKGEALIVLDKGDLIARKREADAELEQTKADLVKFRDLYSDGVIPKRDLELAETKNKKAEAVIGQIDAALEDTIIRAPFSGKVVKKYKEVGETAGSLTSPDYILKLADVSRIKVRAEIEEADIGKVSLGQNAIVTADAFPGAEFTGEVIKIGQSVGRKRIRSDDPKERLDTKVIETEIEMKEAQRIRDRLKVGMTVEIRIEVDGKKVKTEGYK